MMKFGSSLFKGSRAPRAEPLVASAEAKLFHAVFGSFCGNFAKKNGEDFLT